MKDEQIDGLMNSCDIIKQKTRQPGRQSKDIEEGD